MRHGALSQSFGALCQSLGAMHLNNLSSNEIAEKSRYGGKDNDARSGGLCDV